MTTTPAAPPETTRERVSQFLMGLQDSICKGLEEMDGGAKFVEDSWKRPEGGGGRSRVLADGRVFEKGGVNFSEVYGSKLPPSIIKQRPEVEGHTFYATGTSLVIHPRNPYVPTVHLNYRYFEAGPVWWFGGGADLTPYYPYKEDAAHFHNVLKNACDRHHPDYYKAFKYWCDRYFYLPHRNESRGIGGLFFDYQDALNGPLCKSKASNLDPEITSLQSGERSWEDLFAFAQDCGGSFLDSYLPIVERRHETEYGEEQRQFQLYRRGRYVEFNLVYDRGTIFGLQTNGRTESILMSLPPLVRWEYNYTPEPGTHEAELYDTFLKPQDWAAEAAALGL